MHVCAGFSRKACPMSHPRARSAGATVPAELNATGACPSVPLPLRATGRLLDGCHGNCRAACYWHAVAHVLACLCAPLRTTGHHLGGCYSTRRVCTTGARWVLSPARHGCATRASYAWSGKITSHVFKVWPRKYKTSGDKILEEH